MFFPFNRLFTIGQFAKLHEINKKTLMWYDEIGLLKPAVIKENGYRYYSYQQSFILEIILMLRELNVSIPDIQQFLQNRTAQSLEKLFSDQIENLDQTIQHLKMLQKSLDKKRQDMTMLNHLDLSEISIITKNEPHYLGLVDISQTDSLEDKLDKATIGAKKYHLHRLYDASYGSMLSVDNIYKGNFDHCCALYLELPLQMKDQALHIQPAGNYLRAFCKFGLPRLALRYQEILLYAKEHNITFCGFSYEKGINGIVIDSFDDFIMQIEIPIQET